MSTPRILRGFLAAALLTLAATAAAAPPRPTEGHGSNFYLLAGVESLDLDLDPRGSEDFVAAGLDPRVDEGGVMVGVGWVFRKPLRLDLLAGGWRAAIDRPDVDCTVARAAAELNLSVVESSRASLEATFSAAFLIVNYDGMGSEEHLPGSCVGVGATGCFKLVGPVSLGATYQYQLGRFQPKTFQIDGGEPFRVQPTAKLQGLRVTLFIDL